MHTPPLPNLSPKSQPLRVLLGLSCVSKRSNVTSMLVTISKLHSHSVSQIHEALTHTNNPKLIKTYQITFAINTHTSSVAKTSLKALTFLKPGLSIPKDINLKYILVNQGNRMKAKWAWDLTMQRSSKQSSQWQTLHERSLFNSLISKSDH